MTLPEAKQFVVKFVKGEQTPEEYATFLSWLENASTEELGVIADEHERLFDQLAIPAVLPSQKWIDELEERLDHEEEVNKRTPVIKIGNRRVVRKIVWVAAASVVVITAGTYLFKTQYAQQQFVVGNNKAKGPVLSNVEYNVPKGGQQRVFELPDGTKVWLNASSTVKYIDRVVELQGEAFFEVSKNAQLPFRVKIKGGEIDVLGTRFDIQAYDDEVLSKTTLIDGSVRIVRNSDQIKLNPGEQAIMSNDPADGSQVRVTKEVNLDGIMSWKEGDLNFEEADIQTVMRQIARCYNVEVKFEENLPSKKITGTFSRDLAIQTILKQLEAHQGIHFKIDGNSITVMH